MGGGDKKTNVKVITKVEQRHKTFIESCATLKETNCPQKERKKYIYEYIKQIEANCFLKQQFQRNRGKSLGCTVKRYIIV